MERSEECMGPWLNQPSFRQSRQDSKSCNVHDIHPTFSFSFPWLFRPNFRSHSPTKNQRIFFPPVQTSLNLEISEHCHRVLCSRVNCYVLMFPLLEKNTVSRRWRFCILHILCMVPERELCRRHS